jgi:glycerol-3-phosphate dehydrogenase
MTTTLDVDVAIVGAGVIGCSIAARLSMERLRVAVLDRRHDVADETSKSNTGVADCGWECEPGSLESKLILASSPRWEELCDQLDVPFRRCGGLCLARSQEELAGLEQIAESAKRNGARADVLSADQARALAPCIATDVLGALDVPYEGVIDSIALTLGYAELAARNGVMFHFGAPVIGARRRGESVVELHTPRLTVRPEWIVNAAGLGADNVSRVLGAEDFRVWPRRGEYLIVDREFARHIPRVITRLPNEHTRGVMVVPSTHGSVLLGPTADDAEDKLDRSTHDDVLGRVWRECCALVPALLDAPVIKSYAGLRPASDRTYRIERSERVANLIQACGIRSTGVSASPGVGAFVRELLIDAGLVCHADARAVDRIPKRRRIATALMEEGAVEDPLACTIVCACEKVTAREIHDAMGGPLPARSLAGVAKRTRATWGRCQGSACLSGVSSIASTYLDGEAWQIPVSEPAATLGVALATHA